MSFSPTKPMKQPFESSDQIERKIRILKKQCTLIYITIVFTVASIVMILAKSDEFYVPLLVALVCYAWCESLNKQLK